MVAAVDRITASDLTELATDVGPVPKNVGALLVVAGGGPDEVLATLAGRLPRVDRFRQVLRLAPHGLGRPYWLADPAFDVAQHLTTVTLTGPVDNALLTDVAVREVVKPLPPDRPLWRATIIVGTDDDGSGAGTPGGARVLGVVLVMHHVLADGIGGLAVLLGLVDGAPAATGPQKRITHIEASTEPGRRTLLADAWLERSRNLRRLGAHFRTRRIGRAEPSTARPTRPTDPLSQGASREGRPSRRMGAPACSINAPTGPRRAVHLAEVDLAALKAFARARGATINDCLLVAVTGAMAHLLASRGEHPASLVVSVPISARRSTTSADLGNQVGVMPVRVDLHGDSQERLLRVAADTRIRKTARGSSAAFVGPLFRGLAAVGAFRWFVDRQRLVNTFLTNLPGPTETLHLSGVPITRIVPITITAGNVGVAFAALSYAGKLGVTVITDPDVIPEGPELARALGAQLAALRD